MVLALKTAQEWGIFPLDLLNPKDVGSTWADSRNRLLALGFTQHMATICSGCGMSLTDTTGDDVRLTVEDRHCRGCELLRDAGSEHDKPGTQHFLEFMPERKPRESG